MEQAEFVFLSSAQLSLLTFFSVFKWALKYASFGAQQSLICSPFMGIGAAILVFFLPPLKLSMPAEYFQYDVNKLWQMKSILNLGYLL